MVHRIVAELRRSIDHDVDVTDRESITVWLMRMSGGYKLELYHPRTGKIAYEGIGFQGSPELVFDQYVSHVVEDLVEHHVRYTEANLSAVPIAQRERAALEMESAILGARAKLRNRAADIKGRLLGDGFTRPVPVPLRSALEPIDVHGRVHGALTELKERDRADRPLFGWLERFAKSNPALSNLMSFLIGTVVAVIGMWLGRQ
ncbi:hypothetical protein [Brevundimonas sp. TWP2-3-2]|uniref:hypothetical protein n=1 Tax=unclassified Brevundimonas TaxID=2622653 RepID=UPI003CEC8575